MLKRSRSMSSFTDKVSNDMVVDMSDYFSDRSQERTFSTSAEAATCSETEEVTLGDSGLDRSAVDGDMLQVLDQKIDRLHDMFMEQCRLLTTLKEELRSSKCAVEKADAAQSEILVDLVKKAIIHSGVKKTNNSDPSRTLLAAIEVRPGEDRDIRDALASFLQSEELKEHMVSATAESVKDVVGECIARDVSALYLPILEHSQRRLLCQLTRTLEEAFLEMEQNSARLSKSVYKISRSLKLSVERHQTLLCAATDPQRNLVTTLKCTVEELLYNELKQWRQKVLDTFSCQLTEALEYESLPPSPEALFSPTSPQTERSVIDQLMMSAEISKKIQEGEVNAAFESALSAADLSLVTAACHAADRAGVSTRTLGQDVLLALLQQLSTDMLQDTQLKCRYLEDAVFNLDPGNPVTRCHLPLVVGEVRRHLTTFLSSCPKHIATRRVALIIMAAENLLR